LITTTNFDSDRLTSNRDFPTIAAGKNQYASQDHIQAQNAEKEAAQL